MAAPAPSGDPWGYYAECGRSHHAGAIRPTQEASIQPRTESSTEAMDTDEGQRTTARLIEEARHLSEVTMEPTYTTIEEPITTTTKGSEAVISDILVSWPENQGILFFLYFSNTSNELDIFHGFPP